MRFLDQIDGADKVKQDGQNRFVTDAEKAVWNGKASVETYTATLNTTWTGSSAPFSKVQAVAGILATDTPIIDVVMSGNWAIDEARIEAWALIYRAVTANGQVTFYASGKPEVSLPVQIKVVR